MEKSKKGKHTRWVHNNRNLTNTTVFSYTFLSSFADRTLFSYKANFIFTALFKKLQSALQEKEKRKREKKRVCTYKNKGTKRANHNKIRL